MLNAIPRSKIQCSAQVLHKEQNVTITAGITEINGIFPFHPAGQIYLNVKCRSRRWGFSLLGLQTLDPPLGPRKFLAPTNIF